MIMSHASGDTMLSPVSMRQMRAMPPRSIRTKAPARQMHTVEVITAGRATGLNFSMLNTWAEDATIKPPADRPTKNMNAVM